VFIIGISGTVYELKAPKTELIHGVYYFKGKATPVTPPDAHAQFVSIGVEAHHLKELIEEANETPSNPTADLTDPNISGTG